MNDIIKIIDILRDGHFYGAGPMTEIAKGKHEMVTDWQGVKRKVKRLIKK